MTEKKRRYSWYFEPQDAHTNEVIGKYINNLSEKDGSDAGKLLCQDGQKRDLWQCAYWVITRFLINRDQLKLKFGVFVREGASGPIRQWQFRNDKKKAAPAMKRPSRRPYNQARL